MSNIIINNDDNEIEVDFSEEEEVLYKNIMDFIDDMIEYNNKADAKEAIKARVRMLLENRDSVEESLFDRLDEAYDEVEELQIKYSKSLDNSIEMAKDYNELAKKYNSLLLEHNELVRKYIELVKKPKTIFGKIKAMIKKYI